MVSKKYVFKSIFKVYLFGLVSYTNDVYSTINYLFYILNKFNCFCARTKADFVKLVIKNEQKKNTKLTIVVNVVSKLTKSQH